jgi:hypothetical protein
MGGVGQSHLTALPALHMRPLAVEVSASHPQTVVPCFGPTAVPVVPVLN